VIVLPLAASVLSFVFALLVADQWLRRRRAYQLVWSIGLVLYGLAAGADYLAAQGGWTDALYRAWYLAGAFGAAAFLGLGTILLLNRTRFGYFVAALLMLSGLICLAFAAARAGEGIEVPLWGTIVVVGACFASALLVGVATAEDRRLVGPMATGILLLASVVAVVLVLGAPVASPGYAVNPETQAPNGDAFPAYLRMAVIPFNVTGGLALVFGALYSAYIFMPKRRVLRGPTPATFAGLPARALAVVVNLVASLPGALVALFRGELNSRVPATLLIAAGGLIQSVTSGLTRFGVTWGYYLGELLGVLLIFLGFLVSIEVFSDIRLPFTRIVLARRGEGRSSGS
jgi:hypothetical protein